MPQDEFKEVDIKPLNYRETDIEKLLLTARDLITERELREKLLSGEITASEYKSGINPDFIDEFGVCDHCIANAFKRALGDVPIWAKKPGSEHLTRVDYLLSDLGYEIEYF